MPHTMATHRGLLAFLAGLAFVSCSVGKLLDAPPQKVIGVTPARVVHSMPPGSASKPDSVAITTAGGERPWTARHAADASWLTLVDTSGSAPGRLHLTLNPSGLAAGVYRDTIVIVVPDDPSVAQVRVPVELQILGAASRLTFFVPLTTTASRATITPAVEVRALDGDGQPFTGFTGTITLALGSHPTGAALSGTLTAPASGGVARFPDLSLDKVGSYTLTAAAQGLTGATSASFDITPGPASQLRFTVQPSNTQQNRAITPAVEVKALDDAGNDATAFTGNIVVAIGRDASPLQNAQLGGRLTVPAAAGIARFDDLTIDQVGIGYTLTVTAGGLSSTTSQPFDISTLAPPPPPPPSPATHLGFVTQPGPVEVNQTLPVVRVEALDAGGVRVTSFTGTVAIALSPNPTALAGSTSAPASGGEASFTGLQVTQPGSGYQLSASSSGLTGATSGAFNVTPPPPPATHLVFTGEPPTTVLINGAFSVEVTARDANGNTATSFSGEVSLTLQGIAVGGLNGDASVPAVNGVATFSDLRVTGLCTGCTLKASAPGLTGATSRSFNVLAL